MLKAKQLTATTCVHSDKKSQTIRQITQDRRTKFLKKRSYHC